MTSSETTRAIVFVSLAIIGCLIRTYIRTANGEKEDEAHFWSSRFSQLQQDDEDEKIPTHHSADLRPLYPQHDSSRTNTSSGQVSQVTSVLHEQPPRFAPFPAEVVPSQESARILSMSSAAFPYEESEIDEAYEDWAAMHHARGAVSEDAEASIDNLLQRRQMSKAAQLQSFAHFDTLGTSGANTPTVWTTHFPAAQLRPY